MAATATTGRRRWLVLWAYAVAVLGALPFARDVTLTLRSENLLEASVMCMYAGAVAVVVHHVLFDLRQADWLAFTVIAALLCLVAALLLGVTIPEERVHFLQYGVMALLARHALAAEATARAAATRAAVGGALIASALGLLDECIQGLLPGRHFDWRDVLFNASGAVIAIALDELLHDRRGTRRRPQAERPGATP